MPASFVLDQVQAFAGDLRSEPRRERSSCPVSLVRRFPFCFQFSVQIWLISVQNCLLDFFLFFRFFPLLRENGGKSKPIKSQAGSAGHSHTGAGQVHFPDSISIRTFGLIRFFFRFRLCFSYLDSTSSPFRSSTSERWKLYLSVLFSPGRNCDLLFSKYFLAARQSN